MMFRKEYEELEKLDLGKNVSFWSFEKFPYDNDNYRVLTLYIDEPKITNHFYTFLYLREINDEMKSFVTNQKHFGEKGYYRDSVELDEEISKKYLDLFEKYNLLMETYRYLINRQIFGNEGSYCMYTVIDYYDPSSRIIEGLDNIKIKFGRYTMNTNRFIFLSVKLGKNFGIDYDNCSYIVNDKKLPLTNKEYDNILHNTYINNEYTKDKRLQRGK